MHACSTKTTQEQSAVKQEEDETVVMSTQKILRKSDFGSGNINRG